VGHTTAAMKWDTLQVRCSGTHYRCDAVGRTTGALCGDVLNADSTAMHRKAHRWSCTAIASTDTSSTLFSLTGPAASMPHPLLLVCNFDSQLISGLFSELLCCAGTTLLYFTLLLVWAHVPRCRILSPDKTEWRLISATLCGWGRCLVADQLWFMTRIREEEVWALPPSAEASCSCGPVHNPDVTQGYRSLLEALMNHRRVIDLILQRFSGSLRYLPNMGFLTIMVEQQLFFTCRA